MFNLGCADKSGKPNGKGLVKIILIPLLLTATVLLCIYLYVVKNKKKKREGRESQLTLLNFCRGELLELHNVIYARLSLVSLTYAF